MPRYKFQYSCLFIVFFFLTMPANLLTAQPSKCYWQQEIKYKMDVRMDVTTNRFAGRQLIRYKNNSPDRLDKVFFHLYLNAFQPGSAMDVRSRTLPDPDPRVADRIQNLTADEIGYQVIRKLTQNGRPLQFEVAGTILEVQLANPISPGQSVVFEMEYEAQVPLQVRRNGRDNREDIRYSMSQWYPKLCEYDENGWHANPYIGREFYGVWGDFDVSITIDSDYTVAASGILLNAKQIGHGYAPEPKTKPANLTWRFRAQNVHDFVWAADPDYQHDIYHCKNGIILHTFYESNPEYDANWKALPSIMEEAIEFINSRYGKYPYPVYSFIQGGDGGMEYPMATLITGRRSITSLVGVSVHELLHSWYQMVLGFDESHYYWMDEGFTDFVETKVMQHLREKGMIPGEVKEFPYEDAYKNYFSIVEKGIEEPMTTHADHFDFNTSYGIAAYVKGAVFLHQLEYVIGQPAFEKGMPAFYNAWKFKHPDADDFIRIMEKVSGLELDWYKEYMVYSTKTVDYAIDTAYQKDDKTMIRLARISNFPMPVDVVVTLKNGSSMAYTIPLDIMRGSKIESCNNTLFTLLKDWNWVNPTYEMETTFRLDEIASIEIDPSKRLADINPENNIWSF